ncbi:MAG TPA: exo-alpha-sialidase [Gammaproteobacteria bacterium]|nr:exo-alpha-sialidase [Gammaproteobacteria bacterium]
MRSFFHLVALVSAGLLVSCGGGSSTLPAGVPPATEISFSGIGTNGIFDPSVARDPGSSRLWMSYSYVDPSIYFSSSQHLGVGIRLAYSDDGGRSWTNAGVVVSSFEDRAVGPLPSVNPALNIPANSDGTWQSETSSLIYDANAPASERWKIVWHQYLKANGTSYFVDYAWVALKMAATPAELAMAPTIKLFGGKYIQAAGEQSGAPAFSPVAGPAQIALNADLNSAIASADLAELSMCVWAEPALLADSDGLHLAMNCQYLNGTGVDAYIVMFSCANPCNITQAGSWTYKGRVLTPADASVTGHRNFSAAELVRKGGGYYLMVTPVRNNAAAAYDGCRAFPFSDFANARLMRNQGNLVEAFRYDGIPMLHNGACSAHEGMTAGVLHSQFRDDTPPVLFHLLQTNMMFP